MFQRNDKKPFILNKNVLLKNLEVIETPEKLLNEKKRQDAIAQIKEHLSYPLAQFNLLAIPLLEKVAAYYQSLPETALYFNHAGGLLDRAIYRTATALELMRQLMVRDESGLPSADQQLWLYALFSAALLRGIGKLYTEYEIALFNANGAPIKNWEPLHEYMIDIGEYYQYKFIQEDNDTDSLRKHSTLLLAQQLMPQKGFILLSNHTEVFKAWLALLEESRDGAGALDAILDRADALTIHQYLLDYIKEHEHILDHLPGRVGSFLDSTPENTLERDQVVGAEFILWLQSGLSSGKFIFNKPPIQCEIFPSGVALSADVFDMFLQEHQKYKNKLFIQRGLNTWNHHKLNQQTTADNQVLHKIHLENAFLPEQVKIYQEKTHRIATVKTLDLLNDMTAYSRNVDRKAHTQKHLDLNGQWQQADDIEPQAQFEFRTRG